jgi:hypothetical protein
MDMESLMAVNVTQDQAILIFKELADVKKGVQQAVKLLAAVAKHLEDQGKPPAVPVATRALLYPHLSTASTLAPAEDAAVAEEPPCAPPTPSSWRGLFRGKGQG